MSGASPQTGEVGKLEQVEEDRVEIVIFGRHILSRAIEELKRTHPYEVVAYSVLKAEDI